MTVHHAAYRDDSLACADTPSLLTRLWSNLVERQRARRAHAETAALDDRMLRDIGLSRYDFTRSRRFIS